MFLLYFYLSISYESEINIEFNKYQKVKQNNRRLHKALFFTRVAK